MQEIRWKCLFGGDGADVVGAEGGGGGGDESVGLGALGSRDGVGRENGIVLAGEVVALGSRSAPRCQFGLK